MKNFDLLIRRDLEYSSFLRYLEEQEETFGIEKIKSRTRKDVLSMTPRELHSYFGKELWNKYGEFSRVSENARKAFLNAITGSDFDVSQLESTLTKQVSEEEGRDFSFRVHQVDVLQEIAKFFQKPGRRSGFVKLPTGMGKTILFAGLIRAFMGYNYANGKQPKVLVLSPREIVNTQNLRQINRLQDEGTRVGITSKGRIEDIDGNILESPNVTVSTYQMIATGGNMRNIIGDPNIIILDELHRGFGVKTVEEMRTTFPNAILIGFTATPYLGNPNSKKLKRAEMYIGECIATISLPNAISTGALSPVRGYLIRTENEEMEGIHGNDVTDEMLVSKIDEIQRSNIALKIISGHEIPESNKRLTKKALVYCASVDHSEKTKELLEDNGYRAGVVSSRQDKTTITDTIERYKGIRVDGTIVPENERLDILCNCDLLIEGFDDEATSLLIILRPSTSITTIEQIIGRALRLDPNNPGKIADIYNVTGHNTPEYTIFGLANMYDKLRTSFRNGAILFPSRISDVELKISTYKNDKNEPFWSNDEKGILRTYFPKWYAFFFGSNGKIDKGPYIDIISEGGTDVGFDVINIETIKKITMPMDFEYFLNIENLRADCSKNSIILFTKISDNTQFTANNGEMITFTTYLARIGREILGDATNRRSAMSWLMEKLGGKYTPTDQKKFTFPDRYFSDVENLIQDWKSAINASSSGKLSEGIASLRFETVNGNEILLISYLKYLRDGLGLNDLNLSEVLEFWKEKIPTNLMGQGRTHTFFDDYPKEYFMNRDNLVSDWERFIRACNGGSNKNAIFTPLKGGAIRVNSYLKRMAHHLNLSDIESAFLYWQKQLTEEERNTNLFNYLNNKDTLQKDWSLLVEQVGEVNIRPTHDITFYTNEGEKVSILGYAQRIERIILGEVYVSGKIGMEYWMQQAGVETTNQKDVSSTYVNTKLAQKTKIDIDYLLEKDNTRNDWITAFGNGAPTISRTTFVASNGEEITISKYLDIICSEFGCKNQSIALDWWKGRKG